jgi:hypothetical protein
MLSPLLFALLVLAFGFGGWGYARRGYAGLVPAALLLFMSALLWLMGQLGPR